MIKLCAIKDIFGIQVVGNANAINLAILVNLDYSNCKCRKKLVDLVKKTLDKNENKDKPNSYIVCKVLFWIFFIFFIIRIKIGIYFVYCKYVNHNKYNLPY